MVFLNLKRTVLSSVNKFVVVVAFQVCEVEIFLH